MERGNEERRFGWEDVKEEGTLYENKGAKIRRAKLIMRKNSGLGGGRREGRAY